MSAFDCIFINSIIFKKNCEKKVFKMQLIVFLAGLIGVSSQEDWSYNYENQWPGQCNDGILQSPINIMTRSTLVDPHQAHIRGPLVFRGYGDVIVTALNNGHTLQWNKVDGVQAPILAGGPLRGNYTFMQFHLHWLSEHAIDGMKYPMEIHMVHMKTGLTAAEAVLVPDGLAVVAIMCEVRSEEASKHALAEIMPVVPLLLEKTVGQTEPVSINLLRMLSSQPQSYYTYHGSLTTPNCQEVVTWIVMDVPIQISDVQYKEFSKVNVGGIDNYRSLQPVNRLVYRSAATCSVILPGLLGSLTVLLNCLSSSLNTGLLAGARKSMCVMWNAKRRFFRGTRTIEECPN